MQNGAAASLVRHPAPPSFYANRLCLSDSPNLIGSGVQAYTLPTPKQQEALSKLLVFDDEKIVTCLTVLRSIEPDFRYRAGQAYLSEQQLDALSTLKDCGDSDILAWLAGDVNRQRTSINAISTSGPTSVCTQRHLQQPSTNPSLRSSTSSFAPSAVFSNDSTNGTPRSSLGYGPSLPKLPEGIAYNDESNHAHWCTYSEHSKPIYKCEGWKRHEREHETFFLCMPNGPVEYTEDGLICALCLKADPDADHLARHNISICVGKFGVPLKKSRKTDMIKHLAQHRVHSKAGAALAQRWRYSFNKKCFSCGLCIKIFFSITDRSNHIDNEHWRHGQNMEAWELSNSIRGLLLESEVQAAWRILLRSYPDLVESNLRWEMPLAEGLQWRLEMSEEPRPVLAKAALELSNYELIRPNQEGLMATSGSKEMVFGLVSGVPQNTAAATVVPFSTSTYQSLPYYRQPRAPLAGLLSGSPSSSSFDTCDPPLTPPGFFDDSFQPDDFGNDKCLYQGPLMDHNTSEIPPQLSTYAYPPQWPSMDTRQPLDDNTRIQGHLSESGALLVAQVSSPRHGQAVAYANIDRHGPTSDSRHDIHTSNTVRLRTSTFFHGSTAQHSNRDYGFNFCKKPLPPLPLTDLPGNTSRAAEHRPGTPMDLCTG